MFGAIYGDIVGSVYEFNNVVLHKKNLLLFLCLNYSTYKRRFGRMVGDKLFCYFFAPLCFFKTNKEKIVTHKQRAFHKHTVGREKL